MNHQCSLWKGSLQKANATQRSGSNLIDVTIAAQTIFVNDNHNEAFKFDHAWHILQACPKWYHQFDTAPTFTPIPSVTPDTFVGGSSGSSPCDGISGPLRRPEGRDKQKGKKMVKHKNSRTDPVMLEYMERMVKQDDLMEKRREERYEAAKVNADTTTRLRHIDVVTMDLSQYSPRKQKWLREQQNAILGYDQDAPSTDAATSAYGDDYFPTFD
ncbi:unnamed protein product [Cuscuta epithymum]|nr:unnamed protein product [Cuscuta epithymum]